MKEFTFSTLHHSAVQLALATMGVMQLNHLPLLLKCTPKVHKSAAAPWL